MADDKTMNQDEQELDRYGVWVKTGPEDVVEGEEDQLDLSDLPTAEEAGPPGPAAEEVPQEESAAGGDQSDISDLSLDDLEFDDEDNLPSLDDFEAPSFSTDQESMEEPETSAELPGEEQLQQDLEETEVEQIVDIDSQETEDSDQWLTQDSLEEEVIEESEEETEPHKAEGKAVVESGNEDESTPDLEIGDTLEFEDMGSGDEVEEIEVDLESSEEPTAESTSEEAEDEDEDLVSLDDLDLEEPVEDVDPFASLGSEEETEEGDASETEQVVVEEPSVPDDLDLPDFPDDLEVDTAEDTQIQVPPTPNDIEIDEDEIASYASAGQASGATDAGGDDEAESPEGLDLDISDSWEVSHGEQEAEVEPEPAEEEEEEEEYEIEEIDLADLQDEEAEEEAQEEPQEESAEEEEEVEVIDQSMPGIDDELEDFSMDDISIDQSEELPELETDAQEQQAQEQQPQEEPPEHDFTPEDQGIEIGRGAPGNHLTPDEEAYLDEEDDLQKQEHRDIQTDMNEQERAAFEKIQTELADIKRELSQLREQLAAQRSGGPVDTYPDVEEPVDEFEETQDQEALDQAESTGTGFFEEEEEDETIALTGDELDNILSTAEFTETAGTAEELEDDLLVDQGPPEEPPLETEPETAAETADDEFADELADTDEFQEDESPVVIEGDESQVDELADMDIDQELADIDDLVDETEEEEEEDEDSDLEEIELDLDDLQSDSGEEESVATEEPESEALDFEEQAEEPDLSQLESEAPIPEEADELAVTEHDLGEIQPEEAAEFEAFASDVERDIETTEPEDEESLEEPELQKDEETVPTDEWLEESSEPTADEGATLEAPEEQESGTGQPSSLTELPEDLKDEIRSVLSYMDQLLEALPDDKIQEFAQSEHFEVYKRLFEELGLDT